MPRTVYYAGFDSVQHWVNIFHGWCFFIPEAWLPQTDILAVPQILNENNEYTIALVLKQNPSEISPVLKLL